MKTINQMLLIVLLAGAWACGNKSPNVAESTSGNENAEYIDATNPINESAEYVDDSSQIDEIAEYLIIGGIEYLKIDSAKICEKVERVEALLSKDDFIIDFRGDTIFGFKSKNDYNTHFYNKVIANFFKYKDEEGLFEGIHNAYNWSHMSYDGLLIFNFEKGTVKKKKIIETKNNGFYINYIAGFPTDRTITGDFNGDGIKDSLMIEDYWDWDSELGCIGYLRNCQ